jgi:hypothetical protein
MPVEYMRACVCVCVYIYIYIYISMYMKKEKSTHIHAHIHTYIQVRGRVWQLAIGNDLGVTEELFLQRLEMVKSLIESGETSTGPDPRVTKAKG